MDADALVEKALQCMERGDYAAARHYLKQAAALAPLRGDIREMLVHAIENSPTDASPRRTRGETPPPPPPKTGKGQQGKKGRTSAPTGAPRATLPPGAFGTARRRSPWLLVRTVLALVLCTALIGLGAYIWQYAASREPGAGLPTLSGEPKPTPTPDQMTPERQELQRKAESLAEARNYVGAIDEMKKLLATNPPDPKPFQDLLAYYHFQVGRQDLKNQRLNPAIENLERAVEYDARNAEYFLALGEARLVRGRMQKGSLAIKDLTAAEQMFKRVLELDTEQLDAYKNLALTMIAQGKPVEGAQFYRQIIAKAPNSPEATNAKEQLRMMGMR